MLAGALNRSAEVRPRVSLGSEATSLFESPPLRFVTTGPVHEEAGVVCAIDGRLVNARDLARRLGSAPVSSDAELVARAYAAWGTEVLAHLRGAYTILVWDRPRSTGLLAQDHLAQRAVFFHQLGHRVVFASEVGEVLDLLPQRPVPDEIALVHWLAEHEAYDDRTMFHGVRRLRQGEYLRLFPGGVKRDVYWAPRYTPPVQMSREEAAVELMDRLTRSLSARGVAEPGAGIILSGGVDSSAVAAVATHGAGSIGLPSYSAIFPGRPAMDESASVEAIAGALGLRSTLLTIEPQGALAASLEYLRSWQMPVMSPAYWLERSAVEVAAADGIRIVFDGQGGDELFGGSPYLPASYVRQGRLPSAWRSVAGFPGMGPAPPKTKVARALWGYGIRAAMPTWAQIAFRRGSRRAARDHFWLLPHALEAFESTTDPAVWKRLDGPLWWADRVARTGSERIRWGLPDLLRRRAADCGVEAQSPLLGDVDLVEFSLRLPIEITYTHDHNRAVIRQAMRGLIPDEVRLKRTKADFSEFTVETLTGADFAAVRELLSAADAEIYAYVSRQVVHDRFLRNPPAPGDPDWKWWTWRVWKLITGECWLRAQRDDRFVDRLLDSDLVPAPRHRVVESPTGALAQED